uniref:Putative secreted peptide n=1 Tax=Anopheles braziliensis TaxID=58242 RepID=A0A2M3ZNA8_9DIPT
MQWTVFPVTFLCVACGGESSHVSFYSCAPLAKAPRPHGYSANDAKRRKKNREDSEHREPKTTMRRAMGE